MIVEKSRLKNALNKISVFAAREANGNGGKILFSARNGIVSLCGCDGSNIGVFSFPVDETSELEFVAEYKVLAAAAVLRGDVRIECRGGDVMISQGETSMVFPVFERASFAFEEKFIDDGAAVTIDSSAFKKLIGKVSYARREKDSRPFITGVNLAFDGSRLKSEATDALRMLRDWMEVEGCPDVRFSGVLSSKCIRAIEAMDSGKSIEIRMNGNAVGFRSDDMRIYMPLLNCAYPDASRFFSPEARATFILDKAKVLESMEILALSENKALLCRKTDGRILFAMEDGVSDIRDRIGLESSDGENFEFCVDFENFRDIFRNLHGGGKVTFLWKDAFSTLLFRDEENFEGVVMPLRK